MDPSSVLWICLAAFRKLQNIEKHSSEVQS